VVIEARRPGIGSPVGLQRSKVPDLIDRAPPSSWMRSPYPLYGCEVYDLTELVLAAQKGDDAALESLVEHSYDPVWRFCASLVDRQSAEDLAQETFIRVVRALPSFRSQGSGKAWLMGIVRHVCMDELRSRGRRRRGDRQLRPRVDLRGSDIAERAALADLLEKIDPDRRAAFSLTQMLGLSYEEAARVCECPMGTIRSRVARARVELVQLLESSDAQSVRKRI
jgi:RNA polymerase sigma-70 factor, ECF subfamily